MMRCPICGREITATGEDCGNHPSVTYDLNGKVIAYQDWEKTPYGWQTVTRIVKKEIK